MKQHVARGFVPLSGIVPTPREWNKSRPLLPLRPPCKASVSESPEAKMRDLELNAKPCEEVSVYTSRTKQNAPDRIKWAGLHRLRCAPTVVWTPRTKEVQKRAEQQIPFCTQEFDGNSARGFKLRHHLRGDKRPHRLKGTESSTYVMTGPFLLSRCPHSARNARKPRPVLCFGRVLPRRQASKSEDVNPHRGRTASDPFSGNL